MPPWLQNILVLASFSVAGWLLKSGSRNERWQRAWKFIQQATYLGARRQSGHRRTHCSAPGVLDLPKLSAHAFCLRLAVARWPVCATSRPRPATARRSRRPRTLFPMAKPEPLVLPGRHFLGTTQIGKDTLVQALKGSNTALLLGSITSVIYIPLGHPAGDWRRLFSRSWVDDVVRSNIFTAPSWRFRRSFFSSPSSWSSAKESGRCLGRWR